MKRIAAAAIAGAFALGLAGCGERPQVINYKQGAYQGKPDSKPWSNAPYDNNKDAWERAIQQRQQAQNEYKRT